MTNPPILPVLEAYGFEDRRWGHGDWQTVKCPFHPDSHASARLNEEKGVFHCNACSASGNAINLIEKAEGISYDAARQRVKDITGHVGTARGGASAKSKLPLWAQKHSRPARGTGRRLSGSHSRTGC